MQPDPRLQGANAAMSTLSADLMMANAAAGASVVHSHTWYTGMAGHLAALLLRRPARLDRAFAGAAAPVEGRATRWGLPDLELGRADRGAGRGRRHRRQHRDARGRPARLPHTGSQRRARHPQRRRHRRLAPGRAGANRLDADRTRRRPGAGPSWRSWAGSRGRRDWRTWWPPPTGSARRRRWCCAPALPIPRRSPTRFATPWPLWPAAAPGCSGSGRCCPSANYAKSSRRHRFSYARRCTSRWAS